MSKSSTEALPPSRTRSSRGGPKRLYLSLGTLLVLFAGLELGWRVYLFRFASEDHFSKWARIEDLAPEQIRFVPDPYTLYRNNPNFVSQSGLRRHNSLGFRGADFLLAKPAGEVRIACVGGSTTYDTAIEDDALTFCAQLQRVLREEYGHGTVRVINAGVAGYNSWETLAHVQQRVLELAPDILIVYHATNDVHARLVPPELYRRDNSGHRKVWTNQAHWWERSLFLYHVGVQWGLSQGGGLARRIKVRPPHSLDVGAHLAANPPDYFRDNLENVVVLARHHGTAVLLTSWAHSPYFDDYAATEPYQRGFSEMNAASRRVALENDVLYFDFSSEMSQARKYWSDGRHNNEAGARLRAELFAAYLDAHMLGRAETATYSRTGDHQGL